MKFINNFCFSKKFIGCTFLPRTVLNVQNLLLCRNYLIMVIHGVNAPHIFYFCRFFLNFGERQWFSGPKWVKTKSAKIMIDWPSRSGSNIHCKNCFDNFWGFLELVVSIDLIWAFFMPFSYNGVYCTWCRLMPLGIYATWIHKTVIIELAGWWHKYSLRDYWCFNKTGENTCKKHKN